MEGVEFGQGKKGRKNSFSVYLGFPQRPKNPLFWNRPGDASESKRRASQTSPGRVQSAANSTPSSFSQQRISGKLRVLLHGDWDGVSLHFFQARTASRIARRATRHRVQIEK